MTSKRMKLNSALMLPAVQTIRARGRRRLERFALERQRIERGGVLEAR